MPQVPAPSIPLWFFMTQLGPQYKPEHQKFRDELLTPSRATNDNVLRVLRLLGWPQEVQFREAMVSGLEVCKFHKYRLYRTIRNQVTDSKPRPSVDVSVLTPLNNLAKKTPSIAATIA